MTRVLLLELNELNMEFVEAYIACGRLPAFARLIAEHGMSQTIAGDSGEALEPWIQWVTAHTGLTFAEHGVFRLGDAIHHDFLQIWEDVEAHGYSVGAISPMNARNDTRNPAFFIPDPWTKTSIVAPNLATRLFKSIVQVVDDNADRKVSFKSLIWLALGAMRYARVCNYIRYLKLILASRARPWLRALVLDLLLSDLFISLGDKTRPNFMTIFLNSAAHIQHHYMFSSKVYEGHMNNPETYINPRYDPILDIYELYDSILYNITKSFKEYRIIIATALHQDGYPRLKYYWRLKNHSNFLNELNIIHNSVQPRMSRDFLVLFDNLEHAETAQGILLSISVDGNPLFSVDNRGKDLFVTLVYPNDVSAETVFSVDDKPFGELRDHLSFVAIKNGKHNPVGYLIDSFEQNPPQIPLSSLASLIRNAFGIPDQAVPDLLKAE